MRVAVRRRVSPYESIEASRGVVASPCSACVALCWLRTPSVGVSIPRGGRERVSRAEPQSNLERTVVGNILRDVAFGNRLSSRRRTVGVFVKTVCAWIDVEFRLQQ